MATGGLRALDASMQEREIPSLHGLRAVAVATVMGFHAGSPWFPAGQGVTLFFILSGFLITWLLIQERRTTGTVSLGAFYARRSLRIFPAFYVYWALVVGLLIVAGREIHWGHVWSSFAYVGNYWIAWGLPENASLSHTWSLAIEEQFYLILPGLFALARGHTRRLAAVLATIVLVVWGNRVVRVVGGAGEEWLYHATDTRIDHLLVGCLLAIAVSRGLPAWCDRLLTRPACIGAVALLLASMVASQVSPLHYRMTVGFAVEPMFLAVILAQAVALRPRFLHLAPIEHIGRISYGVYLYQQIGMPAGQALMPGSILIVDLAAGVALSLLAAEVSYRLVERRFLELKKRWSPGSGSPPDPGSRRAG